MSNQLQIVGEGSNISFTESKEFTELGIFSVVNAVFDVYDPQDTLLYSSVSEFDVSISRWNTMFRFEISATMQTDHLAIVGMFKGSVVFNNLYTTETDLIPTSGVSGKNHVYLKDSAVAATYDPDNVYYMQARDVEVLGSTFPDDWTKSKYLGKGQTSIFLQANSFIYLLKNQNKVVVFNDTSNEFTDFDVPSPVRFALIPYGRIYEPAVMSENGKLYGAISNRVLDLGHCCFLIYNTEGVLTAVPEEPDVLESYTLDARTLTILETNAREYGYVSTYTLYAGRVTNVYSHKISNILVNGEDTEIYLIDIVIDSNAANSANAAFIFRVKEDHPTYGGKTFYAYYRDIRREELFFINDVSALDFPTVGNYNFYPYSRNSYYYYDVTTSEWTQGSQASTPTLTYRDVYTHYRSTYYQGILRLLSGPDLDMEKLTEVSENYTIPEELIVRREDEDSVSRSVDLVETPAFYLAKWYILSQSTENEVRIENVVINDETSAAFQTSKDLALLIPNADIDETVEQRWIVGHVGTVPFTMFVDVEGDKTPENTFFETVYTENEEVVYSNEQTILDVDQDVLIKAYMHFDGAKRIHEFSWIINGVEFPAYATDSETGIESPIVYDLQYGDVVQLKGVSSHVLSEELTYLLHIHKADYPWTVVRNVYLGAEKKDSLVVPEATSALWIESDLKNSWADAFLSDSFNVNSFDSAKSTSFSQEYVVADTNRLSSSIKDSYTAALANAVSSYGEADVQTLAEFPMSVGVTYGYSLLPSLHVGAEYFSYETHLLSDAFANSEISKPYEIRPSDRPIMRTFENSSIIMNRLNYDIGAITPAIGFTAIWKESKSKVMYSSVSGWEWHNQTLNTGQHEYVVPANKQYTVDMFFVKSLNQLPMLSQREAGFIYWNIVLGSRSNISYSFDVHLTERGYSSFASVLPKFRPRETATETNIRTILFPMATTLVVHFKRLIFNRRETIVTDDGVYLSDGREIAYVGFDTLTLNGYVAESAKYKDILSDLMEYGSDVLGSVSSPTGRKPGYFESYSDAEQDAFDHGYNNDDHFIIVWEPFADHWVWSIRIDRDNQCAERVSGRVRGG